MTNVDREVQRLEEADAWDDSDEVVDLEVSAPLDKVIPVRLRSKDWDKLRREARSLGVGPTTLARMWILETLRNKSRAAKSG